MSRIRTLLSLTLVAALLSLLPTSSEVATAATALATDRMVLERQPTGVGPQYTSIATMKTDGTGLTVVRDVGGAAWRPRLSPDRTEVLYYTGTRWNTETHALWVMNVDGTGTSTLLVPAGGPTGLNWDLHAHAEWSPDGDYLVMSAGSSSAPQIWVSDISNRSSITHTKITNTTNSIPHITPSFSPDQATVVYARCPSASPCRGTDHEIYKVSVFGDSFFDIRMTTDTSTMFDDREPYFSKDGTTISFSRSDSCNGEIWKIPAAGGTPTSVVDDGAANITSTWSDTSTATLYYDRFPGTTHWGIAKVRPNGTGFATISPGTACGHEYPNLTQNSTSASNTGGTGKLPMTRMLTATVRTDGPNAADHADFNIYSQDLLGTNQTRLTTDTSTWPQLSPDRTQILFYKNETGNANVVERNELWIMDWDGSNQQQVIGPDGPADLPANTDWVAQGHVSWSPDGNYLVHLASTQVGTGAPSTLQIWVTDADGTNPVQVSTQTPNIHHLDPSWHPSQAWITYVRCPSACAIGSTNQEIYLMHVFGDQFADVRLTQDSFIDYDPYYAPDGNTVAWLRQTDCDSWGIYSAPSSSTWPVTTATTVINDGGISSKPEWSRDSQWIFFHRLPPGWTSDIWTVQSNGTGRQALGTNAGTAHCGLSSPNQSAS